MDGSKVLGARIDRLVKGDVMARMSVWQRASVAVACAVMLVMAIACRQQIVAAPLRADAAIEKQITDRKAREQRHRAAVSMTAEQAAALERSLESNPDDVDARESLIIFYDQSGKATWEQKLAGIRKHALWRIAHLPATDLWIPNISKRYDPDGYAQAKALWLAQTSRPDVTAQTLGRAAAFFKESDKPLAEQLLIRAQAMEPEGTWGAQLMALYAEAIGATVDPRHPGTAADSQFAADARRKIEASTDPRVLANAAAALFRWALGGSDAAELTRRLFERAVALDPANIRARTGLADLESSGRRKAIDDRLRAVGGAPTTFDDFGKVTSAAVLALPIDDRLFYLPGAAELAYMRAEYLDYTARQKSTGQEAQALRRAEQGFAQARQYASEALALARTNERAARDNEVVYRAESVLGVLALKDGDRNGAVAHMRAAGAAPLPDPVRYTSDFGMRSRLVEYLLRIGERTSVADYLEQSAARRPLERDQLLKDAARVREGMMPSSYQYAEARR